MKNKDKNSINIKFCNEQCAVTVWFITGQMAQVVRRLPLLREE